MELLKSEKYMIQKIKMRNEILANNGVFVYKSSKINVIEFMNNILDKFINNISNLVYDNNSYISAIDIMDGNVTVYKINHNNYFIKYMKELICHVIKRHRSKYDTLAYIVFIMCYPGDIINYLMERTYDLVIFRDTIILSPYISYRGHKLDKSSFLSHVYTNVIMDVIRLLGGETGAFKYKIGSIQNI